MPADVDLSMNGSPDAGDSSSTGPGPGAGGPAPAAAAFHANAVTLAEGLELARACLDKWDDALDALYWRVQQDGGLTPIELSEDEWQIMLVALTHARLATLVARGVRLCAHRN